MVTIPKTMRAVVLIGHGGLEKLELRESYPVPAVGPEDALIKVGACGLNNTDINTRIGWYNSDVRDGTTEEGGVEGFAALGDADGAWGGGIDFPRIQGADVCGTVVAVGQAVDPALIGSRVLVDTWLRDWRDPEDTDKCRYFGSEHDGGYAEYASAPAANIHPIDSDLSDAELATFATSYITAENLLVQAHVGQGDVVLIPGASGGVGSALVQLCRRRGAIPVALCGASKAQAVQALGAEAVLPRAPEDLGAALQEAIGRPTVDVVADVVGGPMFGQFLKVLVQKGRYTCAGAIAGPIVEFDLRDFYLKDLVFTGATIIAPGLFADLVGYIERGEIKPLVAATFPLEQVPDAQRLFLKKTHVGNIVVVP
ncbi:MAG: alcohol dehydrogenase family protein [Alphaproteobacteria bacterium]|nr:alcohol dehydrogenase family protein [Alphaproteobacteria bacterium]